MIRHFLLCAIILLAFTSCGSQEEPANKKGKNPTNLNPEKDAKLICDCLEKTIEFPEKAGECDKLIQDIVNQYQSGSKEMESFRHFMKQCKIKQSR